MKHITVTAGISGFLFLGTIQGYCQHNESMNFRHVKGMQGIELTAGISDLGLAGSVYYSRFFSRKWYGKIGLTYEFKDDDRFDSRALTGDIIAARSLILGNNFFFSLLAGGSVVVYESLDGLETTRNLSTTGVGAMGGGEMEYYLSNKLVLVANGIVRYIFNSDLGKERFYATAGLKFTF